MRLIALALLAALAACAPDRPVRTAYEQLLLDDCRAYLSMQVELKLSPTQSITTTDDLQVVRLGDWTDARNGVVASCTYDRTEHRRVAAVTIEPTGDETYTVARYVNRSPTEGTL